MRRMIALLILASVLFFALPVIGENAKGDTTSNEVSFFDNFGYRIKSDGTICIVSYNWDKSEGKDIIVPEAIDGHVVNEIGDEAFKNADSAKALIDSFKISVVLPDTIETIGKKAFFGAIDISSVDIPSSVQNIGTAAFCYMMGVNAFYIENNDRYATIDGLLYDKKTATLIAYPAGSSEYTVDIPEGVTTIGEYAFYGYRLNSLRLTLPSTLKAINSHAFDMTSKKEDTRLLTSTSSLKNTNYDPMDLGIVEHIGKCAFMNCEFGILDLRKTNVTEIPDYCFYNCYFGKNILFNQQTTRIGQYSFCRVNCGAWGIECNVTIPATVTIIDNYAFAEADLSDAKFAIESGSSLGTIGESAFFKVKFNYTNNNTLVLPDRLAKIGDNAFLGAECLYHVTIPDSVSEIGESAFGTDVTFDVSAKTYAATYVKENGYKSNIEHEEDTSWLQDFNAENNDHYDDDTDLPVVEFIPTIAERLADEVPLIIHYAKISNTKGLKAWKDSTIRITTCSSEPIKYVDLRLKSFNSVGDSCGEIHCKWTGPFETGEAHSLVAEDIWKNEQPETVTVTMVTITYMDDSIRRISTERELEKLFEENTAN